MTVRVKEWGEPSKREYEVEKRSIAPVKRWRSEHISEPACRRFINGSLQRRDAASQAQLKVMKRKPELYREEAED
jgi:hypothetical protein